MAPIRSKITKRIADAAVAESKRFTVWDVQLPGFGLRVTPAGVKTFILRYRVKGKATKRYATLGRYGLITADSARERAKAMLGVVAAGADPVDGSVKTHLTMTFDSAAAEFLSRHIALKRSPKTAVSYKHALEYHVLPKLGFRMILDVTTADLSRLHESLAPTPAMGNFVLAVVSSLYVWAYKQEYLPKSHNPARQVVRYPEAGRERFLTADEMSRLGLALRTAETSGLPWNFDDQKKTAKHAAKADRRFTIADPSAIAAIRLLLLTGCRLREILDLRWENVDLHREMLFLPTSKTGRKTVVLGAAAVRILSAMPNVGPYVFPGVRPGSARTSFKRTWIAIKRHAQLEGLRIHDLRHSFASVGAGKGLGLLVIGKLLGHSQPRSTKRYAHLADDPMRRAADAISAEITDAFGDEAVDVDDLAD